MTTSPSVISSLPVTWNDITRHSPDNGIDTTQFLAASEGLVQLLDLTLKGTAFNTFKKGLSESNSIITEEHQTVSPPSLTLTLQSLVANEGPAGSPSEMRGATLGLVALVRNLRFLANGFRYSLAGGKDGEDLPKCFKKSYEETLRAQHGMVMRGVVGAALKVGPKKREFYAALGGGDGGGASQEQLERELDVYTSGLEKVVGELERWLEEGKWADGLDK